MTRLTEVLASPRNQLTDLEDELAKPIVEKRSLQSPPDSEQQADDRSGTYSLKAISKSFKPDSSFSGHTFSP
jgi:hypothetical protein